MQLRAERPDLAVLLLSQSLERRFATQLAQQQGPQVIASLKIAGMRTNNAKIFALLAKYGVQVTDKDKEDIKKLLDESAKPKP